MAREACHRLIQLLVGNAHPVAVGQLHLDAIENQPIEGFPHKHLVLWHLYPAGLESCAHGLQALAQFGGEDDVVINDRNNLIEHLDLRERRGACRHHHKCGAVSQRR